MNTVAKVLIVFVTGASLTFMAVSGAVTLGGPNWWGRAQAMEEFTFTSTTDANGTTYSSTHRPSGEQAGSSKVLAEVVVSSLNKESQVLTAREQQLDQRIASEQANIQALKDFQEKDTAAMDVRAQEFQAELDRLNDEIKTTLNNTATQAEDSVAENLQAMTAQGELLKKRREDVLRLRDQLALVRADAKRLAEQQRELENILALLDASITQMERRTAQLKARQ
ncbi:MAG: hypothetical protein HUJ26_13765 [Planctomycetaceae bacterium]|nr:hypothetical protein [Planctomycetaceae bacterium]